MTVTRIEDDSDQLKVPADEIPPVRPVEAAASVDAAPVGAAAKVLGTTSTPLTAPPANAPRQIPGLALRAGVGAPASAKFAPLRGANVPYIHRPEADELSPSTKEKP